MQAFRKLRPEATAIPGFERLLLPKRFESDNLSLAKAIIRSMSD